MNTIRALNKATTQKKTTTQAPKFYYVHTTGTTGKCYPNQIKIGVSTHSKPVFTKVYTSNYQDDDIRCSVDTTAYMSDNIKLNDLEYVYNIHVDKNGKPILEHVETNYEWCSKPKDKDTHNIWKKEEPMDVVFDGIPQDFKSIVKDICKYENWRAEVRVVSVGDSKYIYKVDGCILKPYTNVLVQFRELKELLDWWAAFKVKL